MDSQIFSKKEIIEKLLAFNKSLLTAYTYGLIIKSYLQNSSYRESVRRLKIPKSAIF